VLGRTSRMMHALAALLVSLLCLSCVSLSALLLFLLPFIVLWCQLHMLAAATQLQGCSISVT
jgi:hypothetical protein